MGVGGIKQLPHPYKIGSFETELFDLDSHNIQSWKKGYTSPDFWIYVLACTAQTTKSMKSNDIPLKSPIELQKEMAKKILNFPKFVRLLGHSSKKQHFWKMGVACIDQLPRPSKIASFSGNLNEEALLKVSFKNIDRFQKYKALKSKIVKKAQFHKENGIKK